MKYVAIEQTLKRFDQIWMPSVAIVLFITVFVSVVVMLLLRSQAHWKSCAQIVLDEEKKYE